MRYPATGIALVKLRRLPDRRSLALHWDDGATAELPWDLLQGYCPCARCRGHQGGEIEYREPAQPVRSVDAAPVGRYAVTLALEGGCASGIFPFDFLREIARRRGLLQASDDAGKTS